MQYWIRCTGQLLYPQTLEAFWSSYYSSTDYSKDARIFTQLLRAKRNETLFGTNRTLTIGNAPFRDMKGIAARHLTCIIQHRCDSVERKKGQDAENTLLFTTTNIDLSSKYPISQEYNTILIFLQYLVVSTGLMVGNMLLNSKLGVLDSHNDATR